METIVKPTEKTEKLQEYLKDRFKKVEKTEKDKLKVETDKPEKLGKIPGIEHYKTQDGEKHEGLGGKPIHRKAYAKIETREDAARAFLATVNGHTLYIINSNRDWDIQQLKKYNSEIIEIKNQETQKLFPDINKKINHNTNPENWPNQEELLKIYKKYLT